MIEPLILSISGRDRPGLLAVIAESLAEAGIDIVDIEQATLQDFLALTLLIDLADDPARSRNLVREVLPRVNALGLAVDVRALPAEAVHERQGSDHMMLTLVSEKPSTALVATLARTVADHDANIISIRRLTEHDLSAGEYLLDVSRVDDVKRFKGALMRMAEAEGADLGLARENVYRKSKRVVVFDMDSTLVTGEGIDELAALAGCGDEVAAITRETVEGRLEFGDALRRRVKLLAGVPESSLLEVARTMTLTPGAEEALSVLRALGFRLAVVSGGFTPMVDVLVKRLGIDYGYGNQLEVRDGVLTGRVLEPILDAQGKADRLREIAAGEGVSRDQVVGVGDGANDIPMLQAAGLGIAFRGKESMRESADAAIARNDFSALLYLLGVGARDRKRLQASPPVEV